MVLETGNLEASAESALETAGSEQNPAPQKAVEQAEQKTPEPSFDIPRPFLTLDQAASLLGKSLRALERSILGKWGNKLPDGWQARKVPTDKGTEWRILPPPGFRLRQVGEEGSDSRGEYSLETSDEPFLAPRKPAWPQTADRPTIIIDRSEEVEHLLRELLQSQKQLSEERRLRLEDLRLITQMQGSMRLLETRANETSVLKGELTTAQEEMRLLKTQYLELLAEPWWKRLFRKRQSQ